MANVISVGANNDHVACERGTSCVTPPQIEFLKLEESV